MANGGRRRPRGVLHPYDVYLKIETGERRIATISALSAEHARDLARKAGYGRQVRVSAQNGR